MPNVVRGSRMAGLLVYLVGQGRHNEHTEPHLVAGDPSLMAWHDDTELSRDDALRIAGHLDRPRKAYGVDVTRPVYEQQKIGRDEHGNTVWRKVKVGEENAHVWHCSLSLRAQEGQLSDEQWRAISEDFVEGMGFGTEGGSKAPCRWVAVRHGLSQAGNDHVHLVVNLVREDGTKASTWHDLPKAQRLAGELERRYGLEVLEGRAAGRGARGVKPGELAKAQRHGQPEADRVWLARAVRGCATAAADEAEFVRRLRRAGVLARPRYASGRSDVVTGYSVARRPAAGQRPIYLGGGQLARDLTLPRLREQWPDTPEQATAAAAEWNAAARGRRVVSTGRETREPDPQTWRAATRTITELRQKLAAIPAEDRATWAHVAGEAAGVFAAWSTATEPTPGPLAATADALSRSAQLHGYQVRPGRAPVPSVKGAALLVASVAHSGGGTLAQAVLLRQLARTAVAIRDAHTAIGEARSAQHVATALRRDLTRVRDALPPIPTRPPAGPAREPGPSTGTVAVVDEEAAAAVRLAQAGQVPLRSPGSPVPYPLTTPRSPARTTPGRRPGRRPDLDR